MGVRTNGNLNNAARMVAMAIIMVAVSASAAWAQQTVTAMWDTNTDPYTAGYRVYYGTAPGSYQWNVDAGNQTSAKVTLSRGQRYYVSVRAYNSSAQLSPPSNEETVDLPTTTAAPVPAGFVLRGQRHSTNQVNEAMAITPNIRSTGLCWPGRWMKMLSKNSNKYSEKLEARPAKIQSRQGMWWWLPS